MLSAQSELVKRLSAVERLWEAGDLPALAAAWPSDSALYLNPAPASRAQESMQSALRRSALAKLVYILARTQQLLRQPGREAYARRAVAYALTPAVGAPDVHYVDARIRLLPFPDTDEKTYNPVDTAARYFGSGSSLHLEAISMAATVAYNQGDLESADSLLAIVPELSANLGEASAYLYRIKAILAQARGNHEQASTLLREALKICPRSVAAYSVHIPLRLDFARSLRELNDYTEAHIQLDSAQQELQRVQPEQLHLRGILAIERGRLYRAEEQLSAASGSLLEGLGHLSAYPNSSSFAGDMMLAYSSLASVQNQQQDWSAAAATYQECIDMARARLAPNSLQLLGLNLNYSAALGKCNEYEMGLKTALKAKQLAADKLGEDHLYVAVALNTAAEHLTEMKRYAEATEFAQQSAAIRRRIYPPNHSRMMYPAITLAKLLTSAGKPQESIPYWNEAVRICNVNNGSAAPQCREYRLDQVRAYLQAKDSIKARQLLAQIRADFNDGLPLALADNSVFDVGQLTLAGILAEDDKTAQLHFTAARVRFDSIQFGFSGDDATLLLGSAHADLFDHIAQLELPANIPGAWASVARLKYNALWAQRHQYRNEEIALGEDIQKRLGAVNFKLENAKDQYRRTSAKTGQLPADSLARCVTNLRIARNDAKTFWDSLSQTYPAYVASRQQAPQLDFTALAKQITQGQRIIEIYQADSLLYLFSLARGEAPQLSQFPVSTEAMQTLRQAQKSPARANPSLLEKQLAQRLMDYPEENLVVLPDGDLRTISFTALRLKEGLPILQHKTIRYAWNLYETTSPKTNIHQETYPVYGLFPSFTKEQVLPFREQEREGILELVQVESHDGTAWRKRDNAPSGIWHFATHALADMENSERSFLSLPGNDEHLRLSDIRPQRPASPLVVLSACETAAGALYRGEGINSLARAFAQAGVSTTLVSLWRVPDASAAAIFPVFYRELANGATVETALRTAQLEYLEKVDDPRQRHPYYWAGFVVWGQGGKVPPRRRGLNLWWLALVLPLLAGVAFRFRK